MLVPVGMGSYEVSLPLFSAAWPVRTRLVMVTVASIDSDLPRYRTSIPTGDLKALSGGKHDRRGRAAALSTRGMTRRLWRASREKSKSLDGGARESRCCQFDTKTIRNGDGVRVLYSKRGRGAQADVDLLSQPVTNEYWLCRLASKRYEVL